MKPPQRDEVLESLRAHKQVLAERFGVTSISLYGSVARNQATETSDIDILVEFVSPPNFKNYFGTQEFLEDALGRTVDMASIEEIRKEIQPYIIKDQINV